MSGQNVEIVRRLYEAMNARDADAVTELDHPDVEWIPDSRVGEGPIRGRDNVIRFFAERAAMLDELRAETERCWGKDDRVLVFVRVTGRGHASGAEFGDPESVTCGPFATAWSCGARDTATAARLSKPLG